MKYFNSAFTDSNGKVWNTVGENIRYGAKGASDKSVLISVEFGTTSASEVTIIENDTGISDLVATGQSDEINFTSATNDIVNVVGVDVVEADGAFTLASINTTSAGALNIKIVESSAGVTAQLRVWLKVNEY